MGKAGKKGISSLKKLVKSNIALSKLRKKKSKKKPPSPNTEKKLKSLLKKGKVVKKSERIIVKQTNAKAKSKMEQKKIKKKASAPPVDSVESTKIVNNSDLTPKTSSTDFPVTPMCKSNFSIDNNSTPNETISNMDGVYDQSIDKVDVLPLPQVEAIRTISAQVIEDMSERLKSQLLKDIKHLMASEIEKIEIRPHKMMHMHKRHSKGSKSHMNESHVSELDDSIKVESGTNQLHRHTSIQHLYFENLDQFIGDVRTYISQELIGGNAESKHEPKHGMRKNKHNSQNIRGHERHKSDRINHLGHHKHVTHNKENHEKNIYTTEHVSANASTTHVGYNQHRTNHQYDRVPYPTNIRVGDDILHQVQPASSNSNHNTLHHTTHNGKHHANGMHVHSDKHSKDKEYERRHNNSNDSEKNHKEKPETTPTQNYKKLSHKHSITKGNPKQKHSQNKKTQLVKEKHVNFREPGGSNNALHTERHDDEECGTGTSNILQGNLDKINCVIKATQTPSIDFVEKNTMTATEDIEEAGEKLSSNTVPKRVEMPVTTSRLRNFKRRGRWSSMLSAALDIENFDCNNETKDLSDSKQKDPLAGITFKKPGIQYAWSTSRMSEEYKQTFVNSIKRKQQIDRNRNRPINKDSLYNLKPSLNEPKSQNILLNRCLQSLGVRDLEKNQQCLEKVSDAEININLPFSNRILDMLLTYCQSKEFDTSSLVRFKSIWLELRVDEQCIPVGHPTKIKWFELLISLGPMPKVKKGNGKKGTKSRRVSTKTKATKSTLTRRKSTTIKDAEKSSKTETKTIKSKLSSIGPILVPYERSTGKCHFPVVRRTILHTVKKKKADSSSYFLRFELAFLDSFVNKLNEMLKVSNDLLAGDTSI